MTFSFTPELAAYIRDKKKAALVVKIAEANSDIDVQELYLQLVDARAAEYLKTKQQYRSFPTEVCEVLLPNYRLEYESEIRFSLKKLWFITTVKQEGISL